MGTFTSSEQLREAETKEQEDETENLIPPKKSDQSLSPKSERASKVEGGMSKGGLVSRELRKIPTEPKTSPSKEKSIPIQREITPENVESKAETTTSPSEEKSIPITVENDIKKSEGGAKELRKLL